MNTPAESFPVIISNPDEVIWQGEAGSISTENSLGKFDILLGHANFVTIIKADSPIVIRAVNEPALIFTYKDAILAVKSGKVDIYVNL